MATKTQNRGAGAKKGKKTAPAKPEENQAQSGDGTAAQPDARAGGRVPVSDDPDFRPLTSIFPILIQTRPLSRAHHLNDDLIAIARRECQHEKMDHSNGIGKKSIGNIFHLNDPAVQEFRGILRRACEDFLKAYIQKLYAKPTEAMEMRLAGWAYVLGKGGQVMPHIHAKGLISGTYYLKLPKSLKQGKHGEGNIILMNPNLGVFMNSTLDALDKCSPDIKEGHLLLFPSFLTHYVRPFSGDEERIAISFDVSLFPRDKSGPSMGYRIS